MSLDYKLKLKNKEIWAASGSGIYVRRDGRTVELPGDNDILHRTSTILDMNITSNLYRMADAVSVGQGKTLRDLLLEPPTCLDKETLGTYLEDLKKAKLEMENNKIHLEKNYNPSNGWGSFDNLYDLVSKIIVAISEYSSDEIEVEVDY